jgi:hypothetical protein
VVPVDPIKVTLEAPGIKRLNQKCYKLFSNVPLKIDLRRYSMAGAYVRTPPGPRAARVRGALCAVGPSVVSGACTTVGAALFLLGCTAGSSTPPLIYSNGSTVFFTETTQREPVSSNNTQRIPQKVVTSSRRLDECKSLVHGDLLHQVRRVHLVDALHVTPAGHRRRAVQVNTINTHVESAYGSIA